MVKLGRMRKLIIVSSCVSMLLLGCESKVKETDRMTCLRSSVSDNDEMVSEISFGYNEEENKVLNGEFIYTFIAGEKSEKVANIYQDYAIRNSLLEDIEGVDVFFTEEEGGFKFTEVWSYDDVDTNKIGLDDPKQSDFMDGDEYSIKKIEESFTMQGYNCSKNR